MLHSSPVVRDRSGKRYKYQHKITLAGAENPLAKPVRVEHMVLYVVAVPIGNVKDFTLRALEILRQVDYIVCCNRLASMVLLDLIDIDHSGRLIHYRPRGGNAKLIEMIKSGASMALICPQGTPVVGDEGGDLVREMVAAGVRVSAVPGASSIVAGLSMSGVCMHVGTFFFGGYFSSRRSQRVRQLREIAANTHPSVFYEAPERIVDFLSDAASVLPQRRVSIVHEITKIHESLHVGPVEKLCTFYQRGDSNMMLRKGQVIVVIEGCAAAAPAPTGAAPPLPSRWKGEQPRTSAPRRVDADAIEGLVKHQIENGATDVRIISAFVALELQAPMDDVERIARRCIDEKGEEGTAPNKGASPSCSGNDGETSTTACNNNAQRTITALSDGLAEKDRQCRGKAKHALAKQRKMELLRLKREIRFRSMEALNAIGLGLKGKEQTDCPLPVVRVEE